jgi:hypothetical protein|tara:strand:- start:148 stop:483 length:336 start_codon:yes stop_codon:yes gene_type:complete
MWLYTDKGHISVVVHKDASNTVLLRARNPDTLPQLVRNGKVRQSYSPERDYWYRITTSKVEFNEILAMYVDKMIYTNFKAHIGSDGILSKEHIEAYHDVYWAGGRLAVPDA